MGRGDRTIVVRCMLLLVGVLILPLCSIGAVTAEEHSPAGPSETSIAAAEKQRALPAWTEGSLYIHHISTGRGNASYFVMPDGTTMLIDAGEADPLFIASVVPTESIPAAPGRRPFGGL